MEAIDDPWADRVVKDCKPLAYPIEEGKLWIPGDKGKQVPDMKKLREYFLGEGKLPKKDLMRLLREFINLVRKEPNAAKLQEPIFIVGDTHG